jgi:hypothetical protein
MIPHVAWRVGPVYSSWRPVDRAGQLLGSRTVPLQSGGSVPVQIRRNYPRHIQSESDDEQAFGEAEIIEVPNLNQSAMLDVMHGLYLSGGFEGPYLLPYVLASTTGPDGEVTPRHNCVIHSLTIFSAGLTDVPLPQAFLLRYPIFARGRNSNDYSKLIQPIDVYELCKSWRDNQPGDRRDPPPSSGGGSPIAT